MFGLKNILLFDMFWSVLNLTSGTTQIIDNELSQHDCNDNNDHYHSLIITKVFAPFVWLSLENPAELLWRRKKEYWSLH